MPAKKNQKKKNTKKPNAKKAYKPRVKRATIKQIMPIAESRKVSFLNTTPTVIAAEWTVKVPNSWETMMREAAYESTSQQNTSQGFTGRTLFSRFLNQQLRINFEAISHNGNPVEFRVMAGWCKIPYTTASQAGGVTSTNAQGVMNHYNPEAMIHQQLYKQFSGFLPTNDPKKFKLVLNKNYYVKGISIPMAETNSGNKLDYRCVRRELNLKHSWAPNKKYHMIPAQRDADAGTKPDDGNAGDVFWTPSPNKNGELWIPFWAIRFRNFNEFGVGPTGQQDNNAYPVYVQKNTHYFMDV